MAKAIVIGVLVGAWLSVQAVWSAEVEFPDPALEAVVREALAMPEGPIQADHLATLEKLTIYQTEVRDLTGLEYATQLIDLNSQSNKIEHIDALAQMPQLEKLFLNNNAVTDLSPLAGLTRLHHLSLSGNPIKDLAPLAELTSLRYLGLTGLDVTDLSALADLTNLETIHINRMSLTDLEFLRHMTRLRRLSASENQITSLEPLRNLRGLAFIELEQNQIADISPLSKHAQIRRLDLSTNQIASLEGFPPLMPDAVVRLYWNHISDIRPLVLSCAESSGVTLELGENPLDTEAFCRDFPQLEARKNRAVYRYHVTEAKVEPFPGIALLCGESTGETQAATEDLPPETNPVHAATSPATQEVASAAPPSDPAGPVPPAAEAGAAGRAGESGAEVAVSLADSQFNFSVASFGLDLRSLLGVITLIGVAALLVIAWKIPRSS